ncbi:uncharacterized protein CG3556-like [Diadema antillarum]|uniref:uncharacterized protein CG3556-like n=1 Tax=Diadema antillarum TaxID=105358 RepID=UPI003A835015
MKLLWHILGLISQCLVSSNAAEPVSEICGPDTSQDLVQRLQAAQWLASDWLLDERRPDWGWNFVSTGSAILSLHLANETWKNHPLSLEGQLSIKQLEIEVLRDISHRKHLREMPLGQLAYYAMALHATCRNPSNFHGHGLVHHIHHRVATLRANDTHNFFPYSLALLALCSSPEGEIPTSALQTLREAQRESGCFPMGIDVTSMAVMAMSCMRSQFNNVKQLSLLRQMTENATECILQQQNSDGGFGSGIGTNIISTALAAQALIASGTSPARWLCNSTITLILDAQQEDGDFGSQGGTIQILPLLSNRHHGSLTEIDQECPSHDSLEVIPFISRHDETISVNLQIHRVDGNVTLTDDPLVVTAIPGENLFRVMERARQINDLQFESRMTQFGNHIFTINNVENDNTRGFYWFIYEVLENGDLEAAQTGTDGIYPDHNAVYRWVYRKYVSH